MPDVPDTLTMAIVVVLFAHWPAGAVALAIAAALWALAEQRAARRLRASLRTVGAQDKGGAGRARRAAGGGPRGAGGMGPRRLRPLFLWRRRGAARSCLEAPDALALSGALDGLADRGAAFRSPVRDSHGRKACGAGPRSGRHGGGLAGRTQPAAVEQARRFPRHPGRAAHSGVAARQGPGAHLGQSRLPQGRRRGRSGQRRAREQVALDKSERDLAAGSARGQNAPLEAKRFAVVGGHSAAPSPSPKFRWAMPASSAPPSM